MLFSVKILVSSPLKRQNYPSKQSQPNSRKKWEQNNFIVTFTLT